MRILYIGRLNGPVVRKKRGIPMGHQAGQQKMLAICEGLIELGHDVVVLSDGVTNHRSLRVFPEAKEAISLLSGKIVNVNYALTWDASILGILVSGVHTLLKAMSILRTGHIDAVLVYNCYLSSVFVGVYAHWMTKTHVILEYEDAAEIEKQGRSRWWRKLFLGSERLLGMASDGIVACNQQLLDRFPGTLGYVLPGVVGRDLEKAGSRRIEWSSIDKPLKLVYAGWMDESKGIDLLLEAIEKVDYPLEMHFCGGGPLLETIKKQSLRSRHLIRVHGLLRRDQLVRVLTTCDIGISPHRTSWHNGMVWPFKVIEYLSGCGVVICSRTGNVPNELDQRLVYYHGDDSNALAHAIQDVIGNWEQHRYNAPHNIRWANEQWSSSGTARQIEFLLKQI